MSTDMSTDMSTAIAPKGAAIRAFIEAGYTLIPVCSPTTAHEHKGKPCKTPGPIPVRADWPETKYGAHTAEELERGNYGVALHAGDLIIDIDPRNFAAGDNPVARLVALVGSLANTFVVNTGGGGKHVYFSKPADLVISQGLRDFPGIEFKTAGRQVVGPGSLHSGSGKYYEIAKGSPLEVAQAPAALLELLKRTAVPFSDVGGTGNYKNDAGTQGRFVAYLQDAAEVSVEGKSGDLNAFRVACHGRDLGLPPATTYDLMLSDWNDRCLPPWDAEELKAKVLNAYKFAKGAVGSAHASAHFDVVAPAPVKPKDDPLAWDRTDAGTLKKTFNNLINFLKIPAGGLHKIFAFNDLTGRVEFVSPAPWHRGRMPIYAGVMDNDLKLLKGYLAAKNGCEATVTDIEAAVTNVAYHERFHPIREYLDGLKWDGKPRINTWMKDYLGAIDGGYPEYLAAVSRKVLCAAVLRAQKPGIEYHHVVVLEGEQDLGKSASVAILGGDWASDAPIDPHDRDTVDKMQGRWFIEMAEMETVRKADEDALKAFITRKTDRVRLAYGRSTGEYPRQSIFIATKNPGPDGTYLKDPTGNRRWWPVRLEPAVGANGLAQIDFRGLSAARNQLFAEAMHIVKTAPGEKLSMDTPLLKAQAKAVVDQRRAAHEWTEPIAMWIAHCDEKPETRREFVTVLDVYVEALNGSNSRLDRRVTNSIANVLAAQGWTQGAKRQGKRVVWGWHRPSADEVALDALLATL